MLIDQIPRSSLLWMIAALVASFLPHYEHLPFWLWLAGAVILAWRVQIYRGRVGLPSAWLKALLVVLCTLGVWRGFGSLRGVEPMVALLIAGQMLKCLEMKNRRDALLVVLLGYFVAGSQLLFSTQLLASVYALLSIWALVVAQQLLFSGSGIGIAQVARHAGVMMVQALPVMLALFLLMPRLPPLWAMPSQQHAARTGMSDSMTPGDVVNLTQSGKLAFRVSFSGEVPPPEARYWRGLILSEFDGRTWRARRYDFVPGERGLDLFRDKPSLWRANNLNVRANRYQYQILMEPTHQRWLFTLGLPEQVKSAQPWAISRDHTLMSLRRLDERLAVSVQAVDAPMPEQKLHPYVRRQFLALPEGFNPRARLLAKTWMAERNSARHFVEKYRLWVGSRFSYTLQPPALGRDSVDDFLFNTQQGFCEHFASSFVFMARAAGIPARVVAGYQGGELSLDGQYLLVHQLDAHAWAELWIDGRWQRVDPTAFVAPERVRLGLRSAMAEQLDLLAEPLSLMRLSKLAWINHLRLQWDYVNYLWQNKVAGFDRDAQRGLLDRWLGGRDPLQLALTFVAWVFGPLVLLGLWFSWRNRPVPEPMVKRLLKQLARKLPAQLQRQSGETAGNYLRRLAHAFPEQQSQCLALAETLDRHLYGSGKDTKKLEHALVQQAKRIVLKAD